MRLGEFVEAVPVCYTARSRGAVGPQVQGVVVARSKDTPTMTIESADGMHHLCHLAEARTIDVSTLPEGTRNFANIRRAGILRNIGE